MTETRDSALLFDRAAALAEQGQHREALALFELLAQRHPSVVEVQTGRAAMLLGLKRHAEAVAAFDRALTLNPNDVANLNHRGVALQLLGNVDRALASYDRALAIDPGSPDIFFNKATALAELGRLEEALACYDIAVKQKPDVVPVLANRAMALMELGQFTAAALDFDRLLGLTSMPTVLFNRAMLDLLTGDFENGWRRYEARKTRALDPIAVPPLDRPEWRGEPLAGKTLLVHAEQGLGDTIQFCRYALPVAAAGAKIVLSVPAPLIALIRSLDADIALVDEKAPPPPCDYHVMMMSLPGILGTRLNSIPAPIPYLQAQAERVARWSRRLGTAGMKVGICWQGDPQSRSAAGRSMPLACFEPLAKIPGVRLISLQKGPGTEQLAHLPATMNVETLGADFETGPDAFLDCAAAMKSLGLVISADTAPAHLAGALGVPVWVALKQVAEWRWLRDRDDSPWYPAMRLFRQRRRGDWHGVIAEMARELAGRARKT